MYTPRILQIIISEDIQYRFKRAFKFIYSTDMRKKNQMNTEIDDMRDGVESAEEDDKSATDFVQIDVVIQR